MKIYKNLLLLGLVLSIFLLSANPARAQICDDASLEQCKGIENGGKTKDGNSICSGSFNPDNSYTCRNTTQVGTETIANPQVGKLDFEKLNTAIFDRDLPLNSPLRTPRGIISLLLPLLFTLAGLVLFITIIWGGFEMLTGAADPKSQETGKHRITAGLIGFLVVFSAYWLAQIVQIVLGVNILG